MNVEARVAQIEEILKREMTHVKNTPSLLSICLLNTSHFYPIQFREQKEQLDEQATELEHQAGQLDEQATELEQTKEKLEETEGKLTATQNELATLRDGQQVGRNCHS